MESNPETVPSAGYETALYVIRQELNRITAIHVGNTHVMAAVDEKIGNLDHRIEAALKTIAELKNTGHNASQSQGLTIMCEIMGIAGDMELIIKELDEALEAIGNPPAEKA
ncbi:hypothetical protein LOZ53_003430 [Ophidiomyces ophidiicola]|nr:hypothetical protein LOZ55_003138 [Ophidiomyces ophidiicola]KAI1982673.1 hypothetical protein LOZ54_005317 [Ophidiomyces ophidiicola]KAI1987068.1 hypothetical protein LOZ51_005841 [Ophidiomyces ophidiicola]KAI1989962.1 hypothetical protein LOZ53_003430 [Ophidiomyces ophidiicola]